MNQYAVQQLGNRYRAESKPAGMKTTQEIVTTEMQKNRVRNTDQMVTLEEWEAELQILK